MTPLPKALPITPTENGNVSETVTDIPAMSISLSDINRLTHRLVVQSLGKEIREHGDQERKGIVFSPLWFVVQFNSDLGLTWFHVLFFESI